MLNLDIDKIVNGTEDKRIKNAFNTMKNEYNQDSALIFNNECRSIVDPFVILRNSKLIFSEPIYGVKFYKEFIFNKGIPLFTLFEEEVHKVHEYVKENYDKMSDTQKKIYDDLKNEMSNFINDNKNSIMIAKEIQTYSNIEDIIIRFMSGDDYTDDMLENIKNHIKSFNPYMFVLYTPWIYSRFSLCSSVVTDFISEINVENIRGDENILKRYMEAIIVANKLREDKGYINKLIEIRNLNVRNVFNHLKNNNIRDIINDIKTKVISNFSTYNDTVSAVNSIFDDIEENDIEKEINDEEKEINNKIDRVAVESVLEMLYIEYCENAETKYTDCYSLIDDKITIESAVMILSSELENYTTFTEADENDEDVTDDDIDNVMHSDDDKKDSLKKPKPENVANSVQFKAMDAEVKQRKNQSILKKIGDDVKNATKAVLNIPKNVIDSIKNVGKQIDDADEERRKKYMTEPGFRKKIFRNLKLTLLYGSAAYAKLAYVPFVMLLRHFSKDKDRRIRNELIREIQTDIKVCEEKINDAASAGDNKEKYRLIRIKEQLEAELVRVKTNSKYI